MALLVLLCGYLLLLLQTTLGKPLLAANDPSGGCPTVTDAAAKMHMVRFGYAGEVTSDMAAMTARLADSASYQTALETYQKVNRLAVTGDLDLPTRCKMATKRCGNDDRNLVQQQQRQQQHGGPGRSKRFAIDGRRWNKPLLTWYVVGPSQDRTVAEVDSVMAAAFQKWEDVADICFTKNSVGSREGQSDIDILFASGAHGDGNPFDGPGTVLAHAFFPQQGVISGDAHYDEAETWTLDNSGIDLDLVALHEYGHSLGLLHSNVAGAIMEAIYDPGHSGDLHQDDINGIQSIYGARPTGDTCDTTTPTTEAMTEATTEATTEDPTTTPGSNCSIDAAFDINRRASYIIKDNHLWQYEKGFADPATTGNVAIPTQESIIAAATDRKRILFLMSTTSVIEYSVSRRGFRLIFRHDLADVFKAAVSPSAAFMDRCRVKVNIGKWKKRWPTKGSCLNVIVGGTFYQYLVLVRRFRSSKYLFRPVVDGVQVNTPAPMPLSDLGLRTMSPFINTPPAYSTGVDAVALLDSSIIFFKGENFIEMGAGQDNIEQDISSRIDCPSADVQAASSVAGSNFAISVNTTTNEAQVVDTVRRSGSSVLEAP